MCGRVYTVYFMPRFFKDFTIPYYAIKCDKEMLDRHLEEMNKFFCAGVPDCIFDIRLDSCEANPDASPTVRLRFYHLYENNNNKIDFHSAVVT